MTIINLLLSLPMSLVSILSLNLGFFYNWIMSFFNRLAWRLGLIDPPIYPRKIAVDSDLGVPLSPKPETINFFTQDGLRLQLIHFQRSEKVEFPDRDDIVVLMHGLTTSTDMFTQPEHINLVQFLLSKGFKDVFTVDNRISKRWYHNLEGHNFSLEHLIAYDNPAMIEALNKQGKVK